MKKLSIIALTLLAPALPACLPSDVLEAVKTTNEAIVLAEPFVEAGYRGALAKCTLDAKSEADGTACMDRVDAAWKTYVDVMTRVRETRCKLEPAKCTAPAKETTP